MAENKQQNQTLKEAMVNQFTKIIEEIKVKDEEKQLIGNQVKEKEEQITTAFYEKLATLGVEVRGTNPEDIEALRGKYYTTDYDSEEFKKYEAIEQAIMDMDLQKEGIKETKARIDGIETELEQKLQQSIAGIKTFKSKREQEIKDKEIKIEEIKNKIRELRQNDKEREDNGQVANNKNEIEYLSSEITNLRNQIIDSQVRIKVAENFIENYGTLEALRKLIVQKEQREEENEKNNYLYDEPIEEYGYFDDYMGKRKQVVQANPEQAAKTETSAPKVEKTETPAPKAERTETPVPKAERTETPAPKVERTETPTPNATTPEAQASELKEMPIQQVEIRIENGTSALNITRAKDTLDDLLIKHGVDVMTKNDPGKVTKLVDAKEYKYAGTKKQDGKQDNEFDDVAIEAIETGDIYIVREILVAKEDGRMSRDEAKKYLEDYLLLLDKSKTKAEKQNSKISITYNLEELKKSGLSRTARRDFIKKAKEARDLGLDNNITVIPDKLTEFKWKWQDRWENLKQGISNFWNGVKSIGDGKKESKSKKAKKQNAPTAEQENPTTEQQKTEKDKSKKPGALPPEETRRQQTLQEGIAKTVAEVMNEKEAENKVKAAEESKEDTDSVSRLIEEDEIGG